MLKPLLKLVPERKVIAGEIADAITMIVNFKCLCKRNLQMIEALFL